MKQEEVGAGEPTLKEVAVEKQSCQSGQAFKEDRIPLNYYRRRKTNSKRKEDG